VIVGHANCSAVGTDAARTPDKTGEQPVIAVLLPNSHFALECFRRSDHALYLFPLNDRLSLAELERGIRASGASILLTSNAYAKTLRASWSRNEDSDQSTHV
jgi:hypothetical protein